MVFVTTAVLCINGVTMPESSGGVVAHPARLWVGRLSLWSICSIFCVICTCACTSAAQSGTVQQNIRLTLITHFSHPNKASLTLVCSSPRTTQQDLHPSPFLSSLALFISSSLLFLFFFSPALPLSPLFLFNFYFFCCAQGAAPGEHYFQKASSCIIVRIHALISWTIWQTAYAPSSLNALHLLIKWMSHCFQSNTLNLWASVCFHFLSQTRFFFFFSPCSRGYTDHLNKRLRSHICPKIRQAFSSGDYYWSFMLMQSRVCNSERCCSSHQ